MVEERHAAMTDDERARAQMRNESHYGNLLERLLEKEDKIKEGKFMQRRYERMAAVYDGDTMKVGEGVMLWIPDRLDDASAEDAVRKAKNEIEFEAGLMRGIMAFQIFNTPTVCLHTGEYVEHLNDKYEIVAMYDGDFMHWRSSLTFCIPKDLKDKDEFIRSSLPFRAFNRRPEGEEGYCGYLIMPVPEDVLS